MFKSWHFWRLRCCRQTWRRSHEFQWISILRSIKASWPWSEINNFPWAAKLRFTRTFRLRLSAVNQLTVCCQSCLGTLVGSFSFSFLLRTMARLLHLFSSTFHSCVSFYRGWKYIIIRRFFMWCVSEERSMYYSGGIGRDVKQLVIGDLIRRVNCNAVMR